MFEKKILKQFTFFFAIHIDYGTDPDLVFVLNQLYFNATDPLSELWQRAWIIPSFWNVLSYALLAIICILWSPSRNPTE